MELIKIENRQGKETVNARELWEFLGVQSKFSDWIKNRINKYDFIDYEDFITLSKKLESGGLIKEYYITLDMAKELCMVENNERGKQARRYFIECEKQLKKTASYMIEDPIKRAEKWIEEQKEKLLLQDNLNRLIHDKKTYTTTEIAKELNLKSATVLNKMLEDKKVQYKLNGTWVLSASYSDQGLESIKQQELDNGKIIYNRHWTGKGRDFILDLLKD